MPYLKQEDRDQIDEHIDFENIILQSSGELNYVFTRLCISYIKGWGEKYQLHNDCIGALSACQMELARRMTAPYEDKKIAENGDVY